MNNQDEHKLPLGRVQTIGWIVGGAATALAVLGGFLAPARFFQAYLFAFVYWWELSIGMLALALLYQMVGGRWGYASRPFFDSGIQLLPWMALAFIPLGLGLHHVYVWTEPEFFAHIPHSENRAWYLEPSFFLGRAASYLILSGVLGFVATRRVVQSDGTMPRDTYPRFGGLAAVALAIIVSMAAIDWVMSLDPEWYSTMIGFVLATGALLTALCMTAIGVALAVRALGLSGEGPETALHDLGKLMLAFVMLWAYIAFSQYLIVYAGNLATETIYYKPRVEGYWRAVAVAIMILHFAVPFGALLPRSNKTTPARLATIAVGILLIHAVEVYWLIVPSFKRSGSAVHWLDFVVLLAIGGFWVGGFASALKRRLLPVLANWPEPPWLDEEEHHE